MTTATHGSNENTEAQLPSDKAVLICIGIGLVFGFLIGMAIMGVINKFDTADREQLIKDQKAVILYLEQQRGK